MHKQTFPLSPNQARYWQAELLTGVSYHLPVSFYLPANTPIAQLQTALLQVYQQHSGLRLCLHKGMYGEYLQYVDQTSNQNNAPTIAVIEADDAIRTNPSACIVAYCFAASGLHHQGLIKAQFIQLDTQRAIFTLSLHHLIADGYTLCLVLKALNRALSPTLNMTSHQADLTQHSSDYLAVLTAQNTQEAANFAKAQLFWAHYLATASTANIPADYSATDLSHQSADATIRLSASIAPSLLALCAKAGISIFHLIYAAYVTVLARQTGELGLITAFQSHGRQNLAERDCLGLFARTLLLKHVLNMALPLIDLAKIIQQEVSQAIDNQSLSYDAILNAYPHKPALKPKFAINHFPSLPALQLSGQNYPAMRLVAWHSDFDLNLHIETHTERIDLKLFFNGKVYSPTRANTMLTQIETCLQQVLAMPSLPLKSICLGASFKVLSTPQTTLGMKAERAPLYPEMIDPRIESAFFHLATTSPTSAPERAAIIDEVQTWSYRDVALAAQYIESLLQQKHIGHQQRVAILCPQSPLLVMAMLASLKLGSAFCVLDPKLPAARLLQFTQTLQPDLIIHMVAADWLAQTGVDTVVLDLADVQLAVASPAALLNKPNTDVNLSKAPAYFLFTSGTTGEPKCVVHTHAPLVHHIQWQSQQFSLNEQSRFTMLSGLMHDPLLRDIFVPLSIGGCVCIPSPHTISQASALRTWLQTISPTVLHATPSMLLWLNESASMHAATLSNKASTSTSLKLCLIGGEPLYQNHIDILHTFAPNARIVNVYGTTETPQIMAWHCVDLQADNHITPVGQAVCDVNIEVVCEQTQTPSPYAIGEVVIKSAYLSAGYLMHNKAPINSAFANQAYHTGDMAYWNASQQLVLIGRRDEQIKVRGYRVSLAEIAHCASQHPQIAACACVYHQARIVLAYVINPNQKLTANEIRRYLMANLPDYMQVHSMMPLAQLPRLSNLKPDKQALCQLADAHNRTQNSKLRLPETDQEIAIAEAWVNILNQQLSQNIAPKLMSAEATFLSLGGDSLSFIQAALALERVIGFVPNNWQQLRICDLATQTQAESRWVAIHPAVIVRAVSIIFILVGHFFNRNLTGGTDALFLIAGYSFAGFQLKAIELKQSVKPIFDVIIGIAIPTLLISLVHFYNIKNIDIARVFFYGNFILPYNTLHQPQYELYWFIDVLIQILLALALIFSAQRMRTMAALHPLRFATIALVCAVTIAIISAQLWDTRYLINRVPQAKLWLFVLGWGVYFAYHKQQKMLYALLAIGLPVLLTAKWAPLTSFSAFLLLYVPHIKVIRPLHLGVYATASASLMIYLTHFQLSSAIAYLGVKDAPVAQLTVGILGGITLWKMWQWVIATFKQAWHTNSTDD